MKAVNKLKNMLSSKAAESERHVGKTQCGHVGVSIALGPPGSVAHLWFCTTCDQVNLCFYGSDRLGVPPTVIALRESPWWA